MSKKNEEKNNFKDLTAQELAAKGRDLRHEMFNLRLQQASAQLEKPARIRDLRKEIARIETQLSALRNKATTDAATKAPKTAKATKPAKATKTAKAS